MLDKYIMFNENIDRKLIEVGFNMKFHDEVYYEKICESCICGVETLIVKLTKDMVYVYSIINPSTNPYGITRDINKVSFNDIMYQIDDCLDELEEKYGFYRSRM